VDPVSEYNKLAEADPTSAAEQAASLASSFSRAGITFEGRPMTTFLRPYFLDRAKWQALREGARHLLELSTRISRRAFGGDAGRLCEYLRIPEKQAKWIELDPGLPDVVLSRLDAFTQGDDTAFVEINNDAPAGFGYGDRMAQVFEELPIFKEFSRKHPVAYIPSGPPLVEAILGEWHRRCGPARPTVAIVDWGGVKTKADQELMRQAFVTRGIRCILAEPTDLEVRDTRLWAGSTPVSIVYRRALLSELVERESEVRDLFKAYREGLALFVNSFRCQLSEDKGLLSILTDEAHVDLMSEDEQRLVKRLVPWTRKVEQRHTFRDGSRIDLIPYILSHREGLVLKPAHSYGGRSVLVGVEVETDAWERCVSAAIDAPWVVQGRAPIPEETFPVLEEGALAFEKLKVNASPFYVVGADVGVIARASRSSVINVGAGGGSVPTFLIE